MEWIEYWKASIPALVAAIPILILAFQLRQQNRIERKKIEVEYLRRCLEVLEVPVQALHQLQSASSYIALRVRNGISVSMESEVKVATNAFIEALERHNNALIVAQIFAKEGGAEKLEETLAAAMDAAEALRPLAAAAAAAGVRGELQTLTIGNDAPKEVQAAVVARIEASKALVARIHALYG